jgi:hypothetical protein
MANTKQRRAGNIYRWDFQADVYGGQYKLIERVPGKASTWMVERMPADDQTVSAIVDFYAGEEARGGMTTPVWDKTWAECDEAAGERPQRIGWTSYEDDMMAELARYEELAGTRMQLTFVSSRRYAEYF